jgi:mannose-6-phosphate isomerase
MASPRAPILLEPQILSKPWGDGTLLRELGLAVPESPPVGEVWLASDIPGRSSRIVAGMGAGGTLEALLAAERAFVMGRLAPAERFPVLVKLVEVRGDLSLQVHPDAEGASRLGDGRTGKFEAWFVLAASPRARVTFGLDVPLSREEIRALVASKRLEERLNTFTPAAGDAYVMTPGTIHSGHGGLLVLEAQETCDLTYRLYDWGTVGLDGKPRELHLEKALAVADLTPRTPRRPPPPEARPRGPGVKVRTIVGSKNPLTFEILDLEPGARAPIGGDRLPTVVVNLAGRVDLAGSALPRGHAALWPAGADSTEIRAEGKAGRVAVAGPG